MEHYVLHVSTCTYIHVLHLTCTTMEVPSVCIVMYIHFTYVYTYTCKVHAAHVPPWHMGWWVPTHDPIWGHLDHPKMVHLDPFWTLLGPLLDPYLGGLRAQKGMEHYVLHIYTYALCVYMCLNALTWGGPQCTHKTHALYIRLHAPNVKWYWHGVYPMGTPSNTLMGWGPMAKTLHGSTPMSTFRCAHVPPSTT